MPAASSIFLVLANAGIAALLAIAVVRMYRDGARRGRTAGFGR